MPVLNAQLNGVFALAMAVGYFWCAQDPGPRRGFLWINGVLAKMLGAALLRVATSGVGPFPSSIAGAATRDDGSLDVVVTVANNGERSSAASCRTASGVAIDAPSSVFFTELIPPGESISFTQTLKPRTGGQPLSPGSVVVRCN